MKKNSSFPGGKCGPGQQPGRKWGPWSYSHKKSILPPVSLASQLSMRLRWKQPSETLTGEPSYPVPRLLLRGKREIRSLCCFKPLFVVPCYAAIENPCRSKKPFGSSLSLCLALLHFLLHCSKNPMSGLAQSGKTVSILAGPGWRQSTPAAWPVGRGG